MKKKVLSLLLCLCLISAFVLVHNGKATADGLTAHILAGCSYALMDSWGISFTAGNATASGISDFMTGKVESYVNSHGGSIASLFGGEIARNVAGKLVVGHKIYNGVKDFVNWLSDQYDLSSVDFSLTEGQYNGEFLPSYTKYGGSSISGVGIETLYEGSRTVSSKDFEFTGFTVCKVYNDGALISNKQLPSYNHCWTGNWYISYINHIVYCYNEYVDRLGVYGWGSTPVATQVTLSDSLSWNGSGYVTPTVIGNYQGWEGTLDGAPDTNLEDLLDHIFEGVADNNIDVDGEVIDIPIPPPTPVPIDPDTPLSDVPWEGMDTNLQNLYNQGLEEIGVIGDAQDAITDAVSEQTGALEGAIEGNAGVISGAIGQAVSDVQDAISEQTQTLLESATATADVTETIAEALEDEAIDWQKFDLRGLFPFCIPFDIYNMLRALDASPTAPHVQIPFVIASIGFSYTIDLDFSAFDHVAAVMRSMELIVYGIALAWATSKVIKW